MYASVIWGTNVRNQKTMVTDARNGLLDNGCVEGMGDIPDVRYLHPEYTQSLKSLFHKVKY